MLKNSIWSQIHNNLIALISLTVAISALSYNTWRNETTEKNRNIRPAAFEVLKELGQLQLVVNNTRYIANSSESINPILGWGHVSLISDLGQLLPPPIPAKVDELVRVWGDNWKKIRTDEESADKITHEIDSSRAIILNTLMHLK
ncbi:hypothetical protein [Legionella massiliensis]|nr:hypothetical protein [Legionella massiliensis]